MKQELTQVFKNDKFGNIRVVLINNKEHFVATDVAKALGYTNPSKAISDHCRWVTKCYVPHPQSKSKTLEVNAIPEGDLYRLIANSQLPSAEEFERWVFDEVLPSIRKHGAYMTNDTIEKALNEPDFLIQLATKLKEEKEARVKAEQCVNALQIENAQQQQIIGELKPKATYYDLVLQNKSLISITIIAKDYGMGAPTLNKKLHELGVQYKTKGSKGVWLLYREHQAKGYTSSKTQEYVDKDGNPQSRLHTYWTQKGRLFIYDLLKQHGILPLIEIEEYR